jgi:hypothetical protein
MSERNATVNDTAAAAPPVKPSAAAAVTTWAGILAAAGGSLTFNIWHDSHSIKALGVAVVAGILPPFLAAVMAHSAVTLKCGTVEKVTVFIITAASMVVSAVGSAQVLAPGYRHGTNYIYSATLDAAAMACLYFLFRYYEQGAEYAGWLAAQPQQGGNHAAGPVPAASPEPGTGTAVASPEPGTRVIAVGQEPGTATAPEPASPVPDRRDDAGGVDPAAARAPKPAAPKPAEPKPSAARPARAAGNAGEDGEAVTAEMARRHRPTVEGAEQLEHRALALLAEFRRRTGRRMTNRQLGLALGRNKAAIGSLRSGIHDREEAQDRGEEKVA